MGAIFKDLFIEPNPVPAKTALAWRGAISFEVRLPLCEMSEANQARLRKTLKSSSEANDGTGRVSLIGAKGRMGQTIIDLSQKPISKIDITAQCDFGDAIEPAMKNCDVAIDFSNAARSKRFVPLRQRVAQLS